MCKYGLPTLLFASNTESEPLADIHRKRAEVLPMMTLHGIMTMAPYIVLASLTPYYRSLHTRIEKGLQSAPYLPASFNIASPEFERISCPWWDHDRSCIIRGPWTPSPVYRVSGHVRPHARRY